MPVDTTLYKTLRPIYADPLNNQLFVDPATNELFIMNDVGVVVPVVTGGAIVVPITRVAFAQSPYPVVATDETLLVTTTGGVVVITLPLAPVDGRTVIVKRITTDANAVTIDRNGQNIEGAAANLALAGGNLAAVTLTYDSVNLSWWIV